MTSKTKFLEYLQVVTDYFKKTIYKSLYNSQSFTKSSLYRYIEDMNIMWWQNSKRLHTPRNLYFKSVDNGAAIKEAFHFINGLILPAGKHKHSILSRANFSSSAAETVSL